MRMCMCMCRALAGTKIKVGSDCDRCFALPRHQLHYTFAHRLSGGVVSRLIKGAQGGCTKTKAGRAKPKRGHSATL